MDDERWELLEKRVAALEARAADATRPGDRGEFWALEGLRERAQGRSQVLFTGSVVLPTGEEAAWQEGADTTALLDGLAQALDTDAEAAVAPLSALAHPVRLRLVLAVLSGRRTVAELGEGLGTTGQLYHHLRQLTAAGWLTASGRGSWTVPAQRVVPLMTLLAAAGSR
ncbi:ArsR/SmtB family transcription factor [Kineococcus terrestris]|uniref:ArsR/SmtB family transcription factor n=1 Tax=Kineococcus terrestris TaxID=2044856 RepID=UPI0034DAC51B